MTLVDTGPLVALLDKDDSRHADAVVATQSLPSEAMLTTWPCFTEAMYLLGAVGGFRYQAALWKLLSTRVLVLHDMTEAESANMFALMDKYQDAPMDLADASIVAIADSHLATTVFTFDHHFRIYRLAS